MIIDNIYLYLQPATFDITDNFLKIALFFILLSPTRTSRKRYQQSGILLTCLNNETFLVAQRLFYVIKFGLVIEKPRGKRIAFQKVRAFVCQLVSIVLQGNPVNDKNIFAENVK